MSDERLTLEELKEAMRGKRASESLAVPKRRTQSSGWRRTRRHSSATCNSCSMRTSASSRI